MIQKLLIMALFAFLSFAPSDAQAQKPAKNIYGFEFQNIDEDGKIKLSDYKGKVVMIVNTASECGFTPQYKQLQDIYTKYKSKGLVIIGVPSNDFGNQEPGTGKEIARFCEINYGVTFPLTSKYIVSGGNAHPFYKWAKAKLGDDAAPKWSFHKYLIGRNGKLVTSFVSNVSPTDKRVISAIEQQIGKQ